MYAIEVNGLCKKYKAQKDIEGFELKDVSFSLPTGCIMGLIGENGAGKSTTIKLILDVLESDSGTVSLLGKNTAEERILAKDDIGVVTETPAFSAVMTAVQLNSVMKHTYSRWNKEMFFSLLDRFGIDKKKATLKKWRIPESTLLGAAAIGGCYGALIGMFFFKHKTLKIKFKCIVPLCVVLYTFMIGKLLN